MSTVLTEKPKKCDQKLKIYETRFWLQQTSRSRKVFLIAHPGGYRIKDLFEISRCTWTLVKRIQQEIQLIPKVTRTQVFSLEMQRKLNWWHAIRKHDHVHCAGGKLAEIYHENLRGCLRYFITKEISTRRRKRKMFSEDSNFSHCMWNSSVFDSLLYLSLYDR